MERKAIQDLYPEAYSYCYGCGRLNDHGLHIRSYWEGGTAVCHFQLEDYHIAVPGFVYGGLIASLIDCHSIGAAAAAIHLQSSGTLENVTLQRFVTGTLQVKYLKPTPLGENLEVRARVEEIQGRRVTVHSTVSVAGEICARGEVVAFQLPDDMKEPGGPPP